MVMFDLDTFVADCRAALSESTPEVAVRELVARAMAQPAEVERALGTPSRAGVATLYRSAELTILNPVWAPGMAFHPHDHRMWAVIGLYGGCEDNTFYRRSPDGLVVSGSKKLETRDAVVLGKGVVHAVTNPLRAFTGAIHMSTAETSSPCPGASGRRIPWRSGPTTWSGPCACSRKPTRGGARSASPRAVRASSGRSPHPAANRVAGVTERRPDARSQSRVPARFSPVVGQTRAALLLLLECRGSAMTSRVRR
jgi:predicted metal-dependent enzyme (double-stranded beta helix superfamily)